MLSVEDLLFYPIVFIYWDASMLYSWVFVEVDDIKSDVNSDIRNYFGSCFIFKT